jgi:hypothetical protein
VILLTCSPGEPGERRSPAHLVSGRSPLTMLLVIPSARANSASSWRYTFRLAFAVPLGLDIRLVHDIVHLL